MDWIYLSPHLDDVALSCGGLVWQQAESRTQREMQLGVEASAGGDGPAVAIWTICAGDPPKNAHSPFAESLHVRWATGPDAVAARRAEDFTSCERLGAVARHFAIPDAIYRLSPAGGSPLYTSDEALFGELSLEEHGLVDSLRGELEEALPPRAELVCPLGIGGHVDHRLVRAAAESLSRSLWYYADYPYAVRPVIYGSTNRGGRASDKQEIGEIESGSARRSFIFPISEPGLVAWVEAVAAHASQVGSFWTDLVEMEADIRSYCQEKGGVQLWRV
jgi:LmbE family N-acetylglucosaminyl deacetylase